jgi:hypothetical protein
MLKIIRAMKVMAVAAELAWALRECPHHALDGSSRTKVLPYIVRLLVPMKSHFCLPFAL